MSSLHNKSVTVKAKGVNEERQGKDIKSHSVYANNLRDKINRKLELKNSHEHHDNVIDKSNNSEHGTKHNYISNDDAQEMIFISEFPLHYCPLIVPLTLQPPSHYHCPSIKPEVGAVAFRMRLSSLTSCLSNEQMHESFEENYLTCESANKTSLLLSFEEEEQEESMCNSSISRLLSSNKPSEHFVLNERNNSCDNIYNYSANYNVDSGVHDEYVISIKNTTVMAVQDAQTQSESALREGAIEVSARYSYLAGCILFNACNYKEAVEALQKAITLFLSISNTVGLTLCHNLIGVCYHRLHLYKLSLVHHRKQQTLQSSCPTLSAVAEINMALCYLALHDVVNAAASLHDAVLHTECQLECKSERQMEMLREMTVVHTIAMGNAGWCRLYERNYSAAQELFQSCLAQCSLNGDKYGASYCLLLMAEVYFHCKDYQHACFFVEHALRLAREVAYSELVDIARVKLAITQSQLATRDAVLHESSKMNSVQEVSRVVALLQES